MVTKEDSLVFYNISHQQNSNICTSLKNRKVSSILSKHSFFRLTFICSFRFSKTRNYTIKMKMFSPDFIRLMILIIDKPKLILLF